MPTVLDDVNVSQFRRRGGLLRIATKRRESGRLHWNSSVSYRHAVSKVASDGNQTGGCNTNQKFPRRETVMVTLSKRERDQLIVLHPNQMCYNFVCAAVSVDGLSTIAETVGSLAYEY